MNTQQPTVSSVDHHCLSNVKEKWSWGFRCTEAQWSASMLPLDHPLSSESPLCLLSAYWLIGLHFLCPCKAPCSWLEKKGLEKSHTLTLLQCIPHGTNVRCQANIGTTLHHPALRSTLKQAEGTNHQEPISVSRSVQICSSFTLTFWRKSILRQCQPHSQCINNTKKHRAQNAQVFWVSS